MRWDGSQHGVRCSQGLLGSWHCTVYFKEQHDFCTVLCRLSACPTARRRWQAWWCVRFCVLLCAGLRDRGGLRNSRLAAGCVVNIAVKKAAANCSPRPLTAVCQVRPHSLRCGRGCTVQPVARPPTSTATLSTLSTPRWDERAWRLIGWGGGGRQHAHACCGWLTGQLDGRFSPALLEACGTLLHRVIVSLLALWRFVSTRLWPCRRRTLQRWRSGATGA